LSFAFLLGSLAFANGWIVRDCRRTSVRMVCQRGFGYHMYNTGPSDIWKPQFEITLSMNNGWDCTPCCIYAGTTLDRNGNGETRCRQPQTHDGWRVEYSPQRYKRNVDLSEIIESDHTENKEEHTQVRDLKTEGLVKSTENEKEEPIYIPDMSNEKINHCLRSDVRTTCEEGPGRKVYNTGPGDFWDPSFEEDIGEDPSWNCQHCCIHEGKSLDLCTSNEDNQQQYEKLNVTLMDVDKEDQDYYLGWKVDSYKNSVKTKDGEAVYKWLDPQQSEIYMSLSLCNSTNSGTDDWVWLEFKTENGSVCRTNEDFNRNSELKKGGTTKSYHWSNMGECFNLEMHDHDLAFRVQTRKQYLSLYSDEIKICKFKLATVKNIYTWSGEAISEGTGEWLNLDKLIKTDMAETSSIDLSVPSSSPNTRASHRTASSTQGEKAKKRIEDQLDRLETRVEEKVNLRCKSCDEQIPNLLERLSKSEKQNEKLTKSIEILEEKVTNLASNLNSIEIKFGIEGEVRDLPNNSKQQIGNIKIQEKIQESNDKHQNDEANQIIQKTLI